MRLSDQIREEMEDGHILLPTPLTSDDRLAAPADEARNGTQLRAIASLLPTPRASDGAKGGPNQRGSRGDLTMSSAVQLLPTPVAQPSGNTPEDHLRKKPGRTVVTDLAVLAENDLILTGGRLLPTPEAKNSHAGPDPSRNLRGTSGGGDDLVTAMSKLLPTPMVGSSSPAAHGQISGDFRSAMDRAFEEMDPGVDWGPYRPAIERWEPIIGRSAPSPVRYDGRDGKPRLSPELTEWMMGWLKGWVTDPLIGLKRAEQLKACGNGVVPQQAAAALRELLAREGVPIV